MFGWFRPTCPCDPPAKQWVEERLQWLAKQFGLHLLLERPIILPTPDYFPDPYDASPKAARRMCRRVCKYMGVDPDSVELKLFNDNKNQSLRAVDPSLGISAGTWSEAEEPWQKGKIRLEKSGLDRPMDLVGVMAH